MLRIQKFILSGLLMAGLLIAGFSGAAHAAEPAAATPEAASEAKAEKKICKTSQTTGSRLNKTRICKTADEWKEFERANRDVVDRMTDMKHAKGGAGAGRSGSN